MLYGCCASAEDYALVADAGYDYVELSGRELSVMPEGEYLHFRDRIRNGPIPALRINDFCGREVPLLGPSFELRTVTVYARSLIRRAAELGVEKLGIGSPLARSIPEGFQRDRAQDQFCSSLRALADIAGEYSLSVMLEPLNDGVCNYVNHTREAAELVSAIGYPCLSLVFDFHHADLMGETAEDYGPYLAVTGHVHVSDHVGAERSYLLRDGAGKYEKWGEAIRNCGYSGTLSVETGGNHSLPELVENLSLMKAYF